MRPLDEPLSNGGRSLLDILVDEKTAPPDANILRESALNQIDRALELLTPRESEVIRLYFGLDGSESRTFEEIGEMMNLTRARIRQIREKALKKLRRWARYEEQELITKWPITSRYRTP